MSFFSKLLPKIIDPRNEGAYDPQMAQFQQNPVGNILNNTVSGIGNTIAGIAGLPGRVIADVKNPQQAGNDVTGAITGAASGLNNLVGQPVKTKNGKITGLQVPSVYEASKNFALNPVGAVGSAMLGEGLVKGGIKALKPTQSKTLPTITSPELPGGDVNEIPESAAKSFNAKYTVYSKRAGANDLNTLGTSREILAHVKSGMPLDSVDALPDLVTGDTGIVTQMTRNALKDVKGQVNISSSPVKAAGDTMNQVGNKVLFSPEDQANILSDIRRGDTPSTPYHMTPQDAFDYQRSLESAAAKFRRADTQITPNPKAAATASAYQNAANAVGDEIDKMAGDQQVVQPYKTPEQMQALQQISPRLAQQVQNAQTISDLRSTAKPFVRLSKMQDISDASENSTFSKVAQGTTKPQVAPFTAGGAALGGTFAGLPGAAAGAGLGNIVDRALQPELQGVMSKIARPIENAVQMKRLGGKSTGALPAIGSAAKTGLVAAPLAIMGNTVPQQPGIQQNEQSVNHATGIAQGTAPVNYTDIPQDVTKIQPNAQGQFTLTSPQMIADKTGQPLAISDTDYKDLKKQYQAQLGTPQVRFNPAATAQIQSQLSQLETTYGQSKELQSDYGNALSVSNATQTALDMLKSAPPSLFNQNGLVENYNTLFNGKYAGLKEAVGILQKYYPVTTQAFLAAPNANAATAQISQINRRVAQDYYQKINTVTGNVPGVPQQSVQQTAQAQNLAPAASMVPSGDMQGVANPSFNLTPQAQEIPVNGQLPAIQ